MLAPDFGQNVDVLLALNFDSAAQKIRANGPSVPAPEVILIDAFLRPAGSETPDGLATLLPDYRAPNGAALVFEAMKLRSSYVGLVVPPVKDEPWKRLYDVALGDNLYEFRTGMTQVMVNIQAPMVKYDPFLNALVLPGNVVAHIAERTDHRLVEVIDWREVFRKVVPPA